MPFCGLYIAPQLQTKASLRMNQTRPGSRNSQSSRPPTLKILMARLIQSACRPSVRYDGTINAQSAIQLFQQIEAHHPTAVWIYIICDNARYYRSQLISDYLNDSKIKLVFLPPYAPNLNLIERYWKFFKKKILYGRYYETFSLFKSTCEAFFTASNYYKAKLRTLLTDNFQIINST